MLLDGFNTWMALALSLASGWAIMSRRVRDGVIVKTGLSVISVGCLGAFFVQLESRGPNALAVAQALIHVGLLVCIGGYLLRTRRHRHLSRRASDWLDQRSSAS